MDKGKAPDKSIWIFDLDGTLADCTHRLHHIQSEPKNWLAFRLLAVIFEVDKG